MKFKSFGVGAILAGAVATGVLTTAPAYAANFVYEEDAPIGGDLSNNPALPTTINSTNTVLPLPLGGLPANGDALQIVGELSNSDPNDYFQFTLGEAANLISLGMSSAHIPPVNLAYEFWRGAVGSNLIAQGSFLTDGGDGPGGLPDFADSDVISGNFAAGEIFSGRLFAVGPVGSDVDYDFQVEAVPTPALLPGLIGMGVAAWRKRKGEVAVSAEAKV